MPSGIRLLFAVFFCAVVTAGCGGGGGSSPSVVPPQGAPSPTGSPHATSSPGPSTNPTPTATPISTASPGHTATPSPTPSPASSPGISGTVETSENVTIGNGTVVYSCSCTGQAGTTSTDAAGKFTISAVATAVPASPSPTYTTVPGRNYTIVAKAPAGVEAWTMEFLGKTSAHNVGLGNGYAFSTDLYASAAALYVFWVSANTGNANTSYDQWNMYSIAQWAQYLRNSPPGSLSAPEQQLIHDISADQVNNTTLFPIIPGWYPGTAPSPNKTIKTDIVNIRSAGGSATDPVPTPCPGGVGHCTGTPIP